MLLHHLLLIIFTLSLVISFGHCYHYLLLSLLFTINISPYATPLITLIYHFFLSHYATLLIIIFVDIIIAAFVISVSLIITHYINIRCFHYLGFHYNTIRHCLTLRHHCCYDIIVTTITSLFTPFISLISIFTPLPH